MFNLWPKNDAKDIIDNMPKFGWRVGPSFYINDKEYTIGELVEYIKNLLKENKNLNDLLKSIEEDGTEEHNKAVELRQENAQLRSKLDEFVKEVLDLRHLKRENVDLIESLQKEVAKNKVLLDNNNRMLKKEGNSYGITFNEAKTQIIQNDYKKCAQERDEYNHQLNAANKEIEALKNKLIDYQDKYAISFSYTDMNKLQSKLDGANKEIVILNSNITNNRSYIRELEKVNETLKKWKEEQLVVMKQWDEVDQYIRNHEDTKLGEFIAGTCLHFLKERDVYKKEIQELKETLRLREQEIVDYVFEKDDEIQELKKLHKIRTEKYYECNHCGYKIAHNTNQWGGCGCCKDGLMIEREDQQTTAKNLEERFDKNEDVLDYFKDPKWKCPCNICKERKASKATLTWEEAASDLALRVAKLERIIENQSLIIEELKVVGAELNNKFLHTHYEYFKKHGEWPWHWNAVDSPKEYDNL